MFSHEKSEYNICTVTLYLTHKENSREIVETEVLNFMFRVFGISYCTGHPVQYDIPNIITDRSTEK